MKCDSAIVIALPIRPEGAGSHVPWWRIAHGQVVECGDRINWLSPAAGGVAPSATTHVMGIAPCEHVLLHRLMLPALSAKQALAVAARTISEEGLTPAVDLHLAAATGNDGSGQHDFVSIAHSVMAAWLGWADARGIRIDSIIPAALLMPQPEDGTAVRATIGDEVIIRTGALAFVENAAMVDAIIPDPAVIDDVPAEQTERAMAAACDDPPAELLSGRWARRSGPVFDRAAWQRMAKVGAAIALVSLAIPLVELIRLNWNASTLDEASIAAAGTLVSPAPTIEQALPMLDAKLASMGGGPALLTTPLGALAQAIEAAPTVSADTLAWRGDGVLSVTLGAPRNEDINPVLIALQNAGWRVTAQPRGGSDGRAIADITIRSGP